MWTECVTATSGDVFHLRRHYDTTRALCGQRNAQYRLDVTGRRPCARCLDKAEAQIKQAERQWLCPECITLEEHRALEAAGKLGRPLTDPPIDRHRPATSDADPIPRDDYTGHRKVTE